VLGQFRFRQLRRFGQQLRDVGERPRHKCPNLLGGELLTGFLCGGQFPSFGFPRLEAIHDTLETFGGNFAAIREHWQINVRPALHAKATHVVERTAEEYFREVDDTTREAARIATGRNLTPEMVREVCAFGWQQIFSA